MHQLVANGAASNRTMPSVAPAAGGQPLDEALALHQRNEGWRHSPYVPTWVDPEEVGLDRFFTRPEVARRCLDSLLHWMERDGASASGYNFVEPAAGTGAFYDLLPADRRTGIDIVPVREEYEHTDFLSWWPKDDRQLAAIGNPPFGYRAWLALAFMNHAAKFADYVGMILPMAFQSDGKGSPKFRVRGLRLVHTSQLPPDAFVDVNGRGAKVNALWQVWQRGVNNVPPPVTCNRWLDLFTVDNRKERLCGQRRMKDADYFLQRTFYGEVPRLVQDFANVRYVCGYGLVIKQAKRKIVSLLNGTDWREYSNLAAHNCRHISMYHIRRVLTDAGFVDQHSAELTRGAL